MSKNPEASAFSPRKLHQKSSNGTSQPYPAANRTPQQKAEEAAMKDIIDSSTKRIDEIKLKMVSFPPST